MIRNYEMINNELNFMINKIFSNYDLDSLTQYQRRKIIFDYLCNNLDYDFETLEKIKDFKVNKTRIIRNPIEELDNVIFNKIGICNAISQYYKLLLEKVDVKSFCIVCDDGTEVNHQLNLVYDIDNDSYSFDDITSVIVQKGTREEYFDYDLEFANSINQGNRDIVGGKRYFILSEEYINYLVSRKINSFESLNEIPSNIVSIKEKEINNRKY